MIDASQPAQSIRTAAEIQKEYEILAAGVGHKTYQHAVLQQEIPRDHQRMLELNREMQALSASQFEAQE